MQDPPALGAPVGAGELTSERVSRVLDDADWPEDWREIQTGEHTMIGTTLARSRLEEIQRAAGAEGSVFFFDGRGYAQFKSLDWLETDARSITEQFFAGRGDPGDPWVIGVGTEWSSQVIFNDVQYARVGGSVIREKDTSSQSLYGLRSRVQTDLEVETDPQVTTLARRFLAASAYDRLRVQSLELSAPDGVTAQKLLTTKLGDLISCQIETLHGWGYTVVSHVAGIDFTITGSDWGVSLRIDDDLTARYWTLDDLEYSVLGETTRLRPY
jgi:hypothetical protein